MTTASPTLLRVIQKSEQPDLVLVQRLHGDRGTDAARHDRLRVRILAPYQDTHLARTPRDLQRFEIEVDLMVRPGHDREIAVTAVVGAERDMNVSGAGLKPLRRI